MQETRGREQLDSDSELTVATVHAPCRGTEVHLCSYQCETAQILLQWVSPEVEKRKEIANIFTADSFSRVLDYPAQLGIYPLA